MAFIGLGPAIRAPRNAAFKRCSASFGVKSVSLLRRVINAPQNLFRSVSKAIDILRHGLEKTQAEVQKLRSDLEEINTKAKQTNRQILFSTVGRALTAWSKMEEFLVAIVAILLRADPEKAGVVMYSIFNSNTWLSVIHDLFELDKQYSQFQKRFDKIAERIKRIKDQRDQLAHHSVRMDSGQNDPIIKSSRFDARSKSKKQQPLTLQQVSKFTDTVLDIADDLDELVDAIKAVAHESSPKKSDEPQRDQRP